MKTYKNTQDIERSDTFITSVVKETFLIGNMQFFIRAYILDEMEYVINLLGCFMIDSTDSPVFESYEECLRYAMKLFNENQIHRELNGKNCLGNSFKNR